MLRRTLLVYRLGSAHIVMTNGILAAIAQPFHFDGGPVGVLLIHGFGGIPAELRPLGEFLAEQGYTVSSVLLARHGQMPEALRGVRWQDWYASVEQGWRELRARCERVIVIGFSLGGLLALHLAAQQPVDGVILLAAALHLAGGWPLHALSVGRYVVRWYYPMQNADLTDPAVQASLREKGVDLDFNDPAAVAQLRTGARIPTAAIYELVRLGQRMRRALPRVSAPVLVLQGKRDQVVLPVSATHIMAGLSAQDKQLVWFEQSGHQLPSDADHAAVFETIASWLREHVL